jgi:hypothetical protein
MLGCHRQGASTEDLADILPKYRDIPSFFTVPVSAINPARPTINRREEGNIA